MTMNRRQFLKIAGLSTVAGLGGASLLNSLSQNGPEAAQVKPSAGALTAKRWGFAVDVSKLQSPEAYQKCIDACHDIHNVPDWGNPKDEIKWIWKETFEHTFPGTGHGFMNKEFMERELLVFCNHCAAPACTRVCPTKATFKRADGIVMMDMHRCIGCRFCMAACPYGARSFNFRDPRLALKKEKENPEFPTRTIGVVEKCTGCYERLAIGKQPACVEASNGAIVFGDLEDPNSDVRKVLASTYTIRRKPELGTEPSIFYVIGNGGEEHAG